MTLEEESRLSFYKELTALDEKKNIMLVQHIDTKELYVKKILEIYSRPVYEQLSQISVKGVPSVAECIEDNGKLVVIEEYLQGKNLKQIMDEEGVFSENRAFEIALELTRILNNIHALNPPIIHRDIKPSNIIIEKSGRVALIDFNAARNIDADKSEDTRMLGTLYFAAPEQYGFGQSDERTDVYGLGATINYLMTGDKPGAGIAKCSYSNILKKCLMVDPKDRYASAKELLFALKAIGNRQFAGFETFVDIWKWCKCRIIKFAEEEEYINQSKRRYLLPGFRSLNAAGCLLAGIWYMIIFLLSTSSTFTDTKTGVQVSGLELWLDRLTVFLIFFGLTLWFGNYLNIRRKMPGMHKINVLSLILMFAYAAAYILLVLIIMVIVLSIAGF